MPFQITPHSGSVTSTARLNIRSGTPSTSAPVVRRVEPGTVLGVSGVATGDAVNGNDQWYAGDGNTFIWSGACSNFTSEETPPSTVLGVHRRPNGTILPLSEAELNSTFGALDYTEGLGGRINLKPAWVARNIAETPIPSLAAVGQPTLTLNKKAAASFTRVFKAIDEAGMTVRILTCDGTWVPRHKGWDRNRGISSHSWGVTIDINARWNPYQTEAAAAGTHGSVRELVPYFAAEGFAWGGYFSPPYTDGMHFELARYDL